MRDRKRRRRRPTIGDFRCLMCRKLFPATRRDADTCGPTCRKRKSRCFGTASQIASGQRVTRRTA